MLLLNILFAISLLLFYLLLFGLYTVLMITKPLKLWDLPTFLNESFSNTTVCKDSTVTCDKNDEFACKHCQELNYSCINGICTKLQHEEVTCNPITGDRILIQLPNKEGYSYICKCKYPSLVSQNNIFEDCDVDVACGKGHLQSMQVNPMLDGNCVCPLPFYIPHFQHNVGPSCKLINDADLPECYPGNLQHGKCSCPSNYLSSFDPAFSSLYAAQFTIDGSPPIITTTKEIDDKKTDDKGNKKERCIFNPCKVDILSGKVLQHTSLEKLPGDWYGCFCDATFGNIGIRLELPYLKGYKGYNGCTNIFGKEVKVNLEVICSYYTSKEPKCILKYINHSKSLSPFLKLKERNDKNNDLIVEDSGPFHYFYFLTRDRHKKYWVDQEYWKRDENRFQPHYHELVLHYKTAKVYKTIPDCESLVDPVSTIFPHINTVFNTIYLNPVCYWTKDDLYKNTTILNPCILVNDFDNHRHPWVEDRKVTNSFILKYNVTLDTFSLNYHTGIDRKKILKDILPVIKCA